MDSCMSNTVGSLLSGTRCDQLVQTATVGFHSVDELWRLGGGLWHHLVSLFSKYYILFLERRNQCCMKSKRTRMDSCMSNTVGSLLSGT